MRWNVVRSFIINDLIMVKSWRKKINIIIYYESWVVGSVWISVCIEFSVVVYFVLIE